MRWTCSVECSKCSSCLEIFYALIWYEMCCCYICYCLLKQPSCKIVTRMFKIVLLFFKGRIALDLAIKCKKSTSEWSDCFLKLLVHHAWVDCVFCEGFAHSNDFLFKNRSIKLHVLLKETKACSIWKLRSTLI